MPTLSRVGGSSCWSRRWSPVGPAAQAVAGTWWEKTAVSVDTKNFEVVGTFYNSGRRWARTPCRVLDHDFRTDTIGIAIPYGIYDLTENRGTLVVGVSHDTPAFAADAITYW